MAGFWRRVQGRWTGLQLAWPSWGLAVDVVRLSGQLRLPRRAVAIAFGALLSQLWGLLALWATATQGGGIRGMLHSVASYLSGLLPFLDFALPAEPPGMGMVAIATLACWWSTILTLNQASRTLRGLFPLGRRPPTSRLAARLVGPTQSLLWLLAMGLGLSLIASAPDSSRVEGLFRWGGALLAVSMGYGAIYRLAPGRWLPGHPLIPGALLAGSSSLMSLALLRSVIPALSPLTGAVTVISLLLWMLAIYSSSLMLLVGAQLNVSLGRQSSLTRGQMTHLPKTSPPSFESFEIRRPRRLP